MPIRSGFVCILGKPNAGKSTLLNALAGQKLAIVSPKPQTTRTRVQGIVKSALHYYPEFTADDFTGVEPWCGLRPCSPDGLPYLGRPKRCDNLIVATGHAMMGVSLAPITGRLTAEMLTDDKPTFDLRLLSPDRFG